MKSITEIKDFEGKKVLVRVDWNLPFKDGKILDASRIEVSLKTIEYIKNNDGFPIVMSHFGRAGESIKPIIEYAQNNFSVLREGVEFLENLRIDRREEENDEKFAKELASKADYYVNEAFSVSHREHASIVGVPKFLPSFAGLRFEEEYQKLREAFNPEHPFLFILGGAKLETKLPLLEKFLGIADRVFVGGLLAAEAEKISNIKSNEKIIFPHGDIKALDIDQETLDILKKEIEKAKFILWNGPLGKYEEGYKEGTLALAKILAESGARVIAGGGDTENVIDELNMADKFYFISLAGGAMLDLLANGMLPGIEVLNKS